MENESRQHARAQLSAIRVRFERAADGESTTEELEALDIGRGGLFLKTASPLAVGKRLELEVHVGGESKPIAVLARVAWVREADGGEKLPAGMGLKFIDVEEEALERIGELVSKR